MTDAILMEVPVCPRCGKAHGSMKFRKFKRPSRPYTMWAMCPKTKEPVCSAELTPDEVSFYNATGLMKVDVAFGSKS